MASNMQGLHQALPQLLIDVLKAPFDYDPIVLAKSSQTTDIFASKAKNKRRALAAVNPKLTHIVPCPNLVQQLMPELSGALDGIWIQPGDRLSMRVHPSYTKIPLPRAIHSEKDSEDIFLSLNLYPALSLLGFLKAKEKLEKNDSSRTYTNDEIMDYKERFDFEFYAASVGGTSHISDLGVYELFPTREAFLYLPIEIKTPVAFPRESFSQVSPGNLSKTVRGRSHNDLVESDMKKIAGWAVQFNWPERNQSFGYNPEAKLNKILSQVWNQMVAHEKRKVGGHLYISPPCYPAKDGVMDIVIWTLKAAGYLKGNINVPDIVDDWWKGVERGTTPGVNIYTFPVHALSLYNKRNKHQSKARK